MYKIVNLLFALSIFLTSIAQVNNPVKWDFTVTKNRNLYEVHIKATIENGWHIYSQSTSQGGPVPTTISFVKNPLIVLSGKTKEVGKLEQHHEEMFGVDVKQFSNKVDFVQLLSVIGNAKTAITGYVEYMVCNDRECLPPKKQSFSISLK